MNLEFKCRKGLRIEGMDFRRRIAGIISNAVTGDFGEDEIYEYLEVPPERLMGDYALPCFKLSKKLKQAPPKIAADLAEKLTGGNGDSGGGTGGGSSGTSSSRGSVGISSDGSVGSSYDGSGSGSFSGASSSDGSGGSSNCGTCNNSGTGNSGGVDDSCSGKPLVSRIEAVGGYLNFFLDRGVFAQEVMPWLLSDCEKFGIQEEGLGKRVVLEFSSPNIAKPFHIGHMFTTVIGNALKKMYDFLGYETVSVNHLGDWGTQFGKLICAYKYWGNETALKEDTINELLRVYVKYHKEVKENSSLDDEARECFKRLEQGDSEVKELWQKFRDFSLDEFDKIYKRLGISFDSLAGESFYSDKMDSVVENLRAKNLLVESDKAQIVDLSAYNLTPCIVLKSDGATIYATRDIAAAIYRKKAYDFYKNVYVVGIPQALHFKQVFAVLSLMGYEWSRDCVHVGFGLVKFADRQMATREGEVIFLEEVLAEAVKRAAAMMDETRNVDNPEEVAEMVGVGAIIYTFLKNNRERDIIFSWEDMMDLEGDSGPYTQYTCARAGSVLRKAEAEGLYPTAGAGFELLTTNEEFELISLLSGFGNAVRDAAHRYEPSILTRHIGQTARAFNKFYNSCKVLGAEPGLREARLALCHVSRQALCKGLELLGIKAPNQM